MKPNPAENNNNDAEVDDKEKMGKEACAVCKVPAKQKCGACKATFYCGREHQKQDWKEHSKRCKCYKLAENPELGRHYVSSRSIEPGEVVIREEEALIFGPQQDTLPVCLSCYAPLMSAERARPCDECGWPLCDKCTRHDAAECNFTKRYKDTKVSITGFGIAHPTYKCISIVRALALRDTNPEAYERFSRLSSNCGDPEFQEPREIAKFVKRFFNKLANVTVEEIERVAGILQINGHEVPTTEPASIAVYDVASYLEHSCKANCSKSFTDTGGIVVRAAVPIEKGEHITICYTDPLWGTANRRHHLSRTKFFDCACQRCSDPSEFDTMFNAIRCTDGDCTGHMLPKTLIQPEIPAYTCSKCDATVASSSVDELMERVGRDLASMRKNSPEACRDFIELHSKKLHGNHYYMTDVKLALAQLIGQQAGGLPASDYETISEKIILCKRLDDLLKVIVPAENRLRGLVLFEMHAAVAEFGRRQEKEQLYGILQESKRLLQQSYQLLRYEPEILPEGKIARTAKRNLREMEMIITRLCQNAGTPLL